MLVITDPFVVQSSMINLITAPLNSAGIEYDIFHDVVPDAPIDKIAEGVKKFLQYQPEAVIAVGGGLSLIHIFTDKFPLEQINEALQTNLAMTGLKIAVVNK